MGGGIWVVAEHSGAGWSEVAFEVLGEAQRLAGMRGTKVTALALGGKISAPGEALGEYGADEVFIIEHQLLASYTTDAYTYVLCDLINREKPDIVLMGATTSGKDLAPGLAARLKTSLLPNCVALTINSQGVLGGTRAIYDGNVYSTWTCPPKKPQIATIPPGTTGKEQPQKYRQATVTRLKVDLPEDVLRTRVTGIIPADPRTMDISEADILVAFGRGLGGAEKVSVIEELAGLIGAAVGGSRPTVDNGWLPPGRQIGLTGKTVAARLIIVFGVSGATQFTTGIKGCQFIVAINTDKAAPIFKMADISIKCDLHQLLPCMISQLKKSSKPQAGVSTGGG